MRSGVLAVVMVCAVGCSTTHGIELELDASADLTADSIAVYIGDASKDIPTRASIATRGKTPMGSAKFGTFFPDTHGAVEVLELTKSQRTKTLTLTPGAGSDILTIVAVGMTGDMPTSVATLIKVPLDPNVILLWQVDLEPLQNNRSVAVWGERPEDKTCVHVTDPNAKLEELENVYIGTGGDKDCDGFPEKVQGMKNRAECHDDWHRSKTVPSISTLSCMKNLQVTESGIGTTVDTCVVGAPKCEDGMPMDRDDCSLQKPFCAPMGLCSSCPMVADADDRLACALALDPQEGMSIPHVRCVLEIDTTVMPNRMCPLPNIASPPPGYFSGQPNCSGPPLFHRQDRASGWSSTAEIGKISLSFASNPTGGPCSMQITSVLPPMTQVDHGAFPAHGLVAVELGSGRGIVGPIVFELQEVSQCSNVSRDCMPTMTAAEGSLQKCLMFAPATP